MSEHEGERDQPYPPPGAGEDQPPAYGQPPSGQPAYGQPPSRAAPRTGALPTVNARTGAADGQPPYGSPPYGQQPAYGSPPYGQQPAYGSAPYPGDVAMYPEPSQAVLALVVAIVGLVAFQLVCPVAWVLANREIKGIDQGRRNPANRGMAVAAKIIGIIGSVLLVLGVLFVLLVIGGLFAASSRS